MNPGGEKSAAILEDILKNHVAAVLSPSSAGSNGSRASRYECELCLEGFNLYDRKPYCLVPCGHSLCIRCFESLTKTTCPYCRAAFTSKIPNWEIVKRLPKPMVPIVFYQVEKKMVALETLANEYTKIIVEVNQDYRKKLAQIVCDESIRKSNSDRLKRIDKRLDEINANNQEAENNIRRKMDKIKSQLETDEVKYNEESLKRNKTELEKLSVNMIERIRILRKDRDEFMSVLNGYANSTPAVELLARIENELRDNSAYKQVYKELNSIFAAANVVRPLSNASDVPSITETGAEAEEVMNCRPSQKSNYDYHLTSSQ